MDAPNGASASSRRPPPSTAPRIRVRRSAEPFARPPTDSMNSIDRTARQPSVAESQIAVWSGSGTPAPDGSSIPRRTGAHAPTTANNVRSKRERPVKRTDG